MRSASEIVSGERAGSGRAGIFFSGGSGTSVVERVAGRRQVRPVINRNFRFFRSLGRVCGFFLFDRRRAAGRHCSQKNGGGGHPSSAAPVFHR